MSAAKFLPTSTRMSREKNIENLYIIYKFIYTYIYKYIYVYKFIQCDALRCDAAALFFHIVSLFCKSQILAEKLRKFSQAIFRLHFSEGRGSSSSSSCCSCFARCRCRCGPRSCSWSICQQTECCWHFPRSLTILIYLVF